MDCIPRTLSHAQTMDALTSMSTVTGYKSVLIAAMYLRKFVPMIATPIGTTEPAKFLLIGTGVVGLQSLATAKRLGGITFGFDIRPEAREQALSLGAKVVGFEVPPEFAIGEGGYAKSLSEEWLLKEREALKPHVTDVDVIITSALVPGEEAPILITEDMVKGMKSGSVIIDVSIDQGGNCDITEPGKTVQKHDVWICGTMNIPGSMPIDSTWLYANNMFNYIENLFKGSLGKIDFSDKVVSSSLVTRGGKIVHKGTLKAFEEA
jgi:NAD(P) transhydrogenase subunit alpha